MHDRMLTINPMGILGLMLAVRLDHAHKAKAQVVACIAQQEGELLRWYRHQNLDLGQRE